MGADRLRADQVPNEFLTFRSSAVETRHPIRLYSRYINKVRPRLDLQHWLSSFSGRSLVLASALQRCCLSVQPSSQLIELPCSCEQQSVAARHALLSALCSQHVHSSLFLRTAG